MEDRSSDDRSSQDDRSNFEPIPTVSHRASGMRRFLLLGAITLVASACVVAFGSPLFQTLGFEYSAIAALILSITAGLDGAMSSARRGFSNGLAMALGRGALLSFVPMMVSLAGLAILPNCALNDGLILYAEIAIPTALLASGYGFGCASILGPVASRRGFGVAAFMVFWLVTLLLSLLPGYTNPQLYGYGWQYGYFPGFVWDRAIELNPAYIASRFEQLVWLALLLSVGHDLFFRSATRARFVVAGILMLITVALLGSQDNLGVTASESQVREQLRTEAYLGGRAWVHYVDGGLTSQEIEELQHDVPIWLKEIRSTYDLRDDFESIQIYVYPDASTDDRSSMEQLVGTRAASIAKPWLGQVHIMRSALGSLKHELTHVVLRTIGNFPFYASWSTGLTEGAAVAMEAPNGALQTNDELATQLLQARMASGVSDVMQFTGFAAENSHKSYTLAGSFVRYLISHYGPVRFRDVYSSLDYEHAYRKPLAVLEREWRASLLSTAKPLDSSDLVRLRLLFGTPSILSMPCVRRLGKLERKATIAFEHDNLGDAYRYGFQAYNEGGGAADAWAAARSLFMLGRLSDARALLDTARVGQKTELLGIPIADLSWIALDTGISRPYYGQALNLRLGSTSFFTAYDRTVLLKSDVSREFADYLSLAYRTRVPDYPRTLKLLDTLLTRHSRRSGFDPVEMVLLYIKMRNLEEMGWPQLAAKYDPLLVTPLTSDSIGSDDSLAISIVERHMWRYRAPSVAARYIPAKYRVAADADRYETQSVLRRQYGVLDPSAEHAPGRENAR